LKKGFQIDGFSISKSEQFFMYLFAYVADTFQLEYEDEHASPYIFVNPIQYPNVNNFLLLIVIKIKILNWILSLGMKIEKNMFLMALGKYEEPKLPNVYLCSVGGFL
jgi:hypothetical protein